MARPPSLSLVIPVYNEEECIVDCAREVAAVVRDQTDDWELIVVDDGSVDATLERLRALRAEIPQLRILRHKTNAGQSAAFATGFRAARNTLIVTLDGDGQNDPNDIPKLLASLNDAGAACGIRMNRKDDLRKRLTSRIANGVRNYLTSEDIKDTGCSLKVFRREAVQHLKIFDGMHRFLPTLVRMEGYRVIQVPVNHRPRRKGQSKYGFHNRLFRPIQDLLAVRWMQKRTVRVEVEELDE